MEIKTSSIFPSLLTALFVGLKLTGHITWSWLWVLSPLWLPIVVCFLFAGTCFLIAFVLNNYA